MQSSSTAGPPARWIAPSTPPPPRIARLAALTTASTSCAVMSPCDDGDLHQLELPQQPQRRALQRGLALVGGRRSVRRVASLDGPALARRRRPPAGRRTTSAPGSGCCRGTTPPPSSRRRPRACARPWSPPAPGVSASAAAASTVACQVRKSLAVASSPVESRTYSLTRSGSSERHDAAVLVGRAAAGRSPPPPAHDLDGLDHHGVVDLDLVLDAGLADEREDQPVLVPAHVPALEGGEPEACRSSSA